MNAIKHHLPQKCYSSRTMNSIDAIIIHYISAINIPNSDPFDTDTIIRIFESYKVSAHFLIERDGTIIELVPLPHIAYHAGKSEWQGRDWLNGWSVGIEFVATHDSGFTEDQYAAGQLLCAQLMGEYGIEPDMILGHEQVAPGRKIDPGPKFDWHRFKGALMDVVS